MNNHLITHKLIIADVLRNWPQTVQIFLDHKMNCVGCSMAAFETLEDAAHIYGLVVDTFIDEINLSIHEAQ